MKSRSLLRYGLLAVLAALVLPSCGEEPDGPSATVAAPAVVMVNPANGSSDLEVPALTVTFVFDQNVKALSSDAAKVTLSPSATVSGLYASGNSVAVSLDGLDYGTSYTLTVPWGVIKGFRENQEPVEDLSYIFSTREKPEEEKDYERNPVSSLTDANAGPSARSLYASLLKVYGSKVLSGTMGGSSWDTGFSDFVAEQAACGKYPAVVGFDYLFMHYPPHIWSSTTPPDYSDITPVKEAWEKGSVIQVCWHMNMPKNEAAFPDHPENYAFYVSNFGGSVFSATAAVTEGTWQNRAFDYYIERLAGYLGALQDAGIPILFRPFHEAAGDYGWKNPWFWWGYEGAEPLVNLWKYLKDALEGTYGIHNLIWVYTVQTSTSGALASVSDIEPWYPGDDYVDIVGCDLYVGKNTTQSETFKRVNNFVKGRKMVALSENGNLLDFEKAFSEDAPWLWFMGWNSGSSGNWSLSSDSWNNTAADWKKAMTGSHTINRGELK